MERGEHLALVDRGGTYFQPSTTNPCSHTFRFLTQERFAFDLELELSAVPPQMKHTNAGLSQPSVSLDCTDCCKMNIFWARGAPSPKEDIIVNRYSTEMFETAGSKVSQLSTTSLRHPKRPAAAPSLKFTPK
ncbi:hypothetical protein CHARACLAT_004016 [Characodon lateralis]|uniref:Uncharacterized protein n=1 Tax=Characodon lateralis TaxID=208331 RepID=A0ABU7EHH0_9TELE|nr:hypothetical protein [Characodon lateralis]